MIVPHTDMVVVGQLASGKYSIRSIPIDVGEFAPAPEHIFTVSGPTAMSDQGLELVPDCDGRTRSDRRAVRIPPRARVRVVSACAVIGRGS